MLHARTLPTQLCFDGEREVQGTDSSATQVNTLRGAAYIGCGASPPNNGTRLLPQPEQKQVIKHASPGKLVAGRVQARPVPSECSLA